MSMPWMHCAEKFNVSTVLGFWGLPLTGNSLKLGPLRLHLLAFQAENVGSVVAISAGHVPLNNNIQLFSPQIPICSYSHCIPKDCR